MRSLNKIMIIGNLGKDPELRYTGTGIAVANFTVATNTTWKDSEGNEKEQVEWHNVVCWRKLAEIVGEHLKKGMKVYLEGRMSYRRWKDSEQNDRLTPEIICDDIVFLTKKELAGQEDRATSTAPDDPSA